MPQGIQITVRHFKEIDGGVFWTLSKLTIGLFRGLPFLESVFDVHHFFFFTLYIITTYQFSSVCVCVCVCVCVWPMCLSLCICAYMYTHTYTLPATLSSAMKWSPSSVWIFCHHCRGENGLCVCVCVCVCVCMCVLELIPAYMYTHTLPATLSSAIKRSPSSVWIFCHHYGGEYGLCVCARAYAS